jgi:hypothetical protein
MYIFLDFDGVLRRLSSATSRFEPELLKNFESVVRPVAEVKIIIASAWRLEMPLNELQQLFSPDVAERVVGATPEHLALTAHSRYNEVRSYLKTAQAIQATWLAIDDDPAHYPDDAPLLITDPYQGFDQACADRLLEFFHHCQYSVD